MEEYKFKNKIYEYEAIKMSLLELLDIVRKQRALFTMKKGEVNC